jgi:DNA sulfur modification protein DndD
MAKVTFRGIAIQNLGPYRERQYLDLTVRAGRPILLVNALNGSGKTTLLTCLQVALYGAKAIGNGKASEFEAMIRGLHRDDAMGPARVEVELSVESNGVRDLINVSREWSLGAKLGERLTVTKDGIEDATLTAEWHDYLDRILPAELLQLFLFDGEKIEALANPKTLPGMLRSATEAFLGIGGIDTLSRDLVAVERRTVLSAKRSNSDYEIAKAELEQLEQQQQSAQSAVDALKQALPAAESQVAKVKDAYESASLHAERSGLVAYEKAAEIKAAEQAARTEVSAAAAAVRDALSDPLSAIAQLGEMWAQYKQQWASEQDTRAAKHLLNEIERRDRRVLKDLRAVMGDKAFSAVKLALSQDTERYQRAADRPMFLQPAPDPESLDHAIKAADTRHKQARKRLAAAKQKLADMERQVAAIPEGDQLADILADLKKKSDEVARAEERLQFLLKQLGEQESMLAHVTLRTNAARQRMSKDFQGEALDMKAIAAAQRTRAVLAVFKDKLLASKARWLSEKITEEFKALMRKQMLVKEVRVHPETYDVTIVGGHNKLLPMERLSAGERQLLAIAVLSALIRERRGQFPVVVDTPLARLDRSHREALIKRFFAKVSHQVMVLSTDEEVEGSVYEAMQRYTSKAFVIEFSDAQRASEVSEVPLLMAA